MDEVRLKDASKPEAIAGAHNPPLVLSESADPLSSSQSDCERKLLEFIRQQRGQSFEAVELDTPLIETGILGSLEILGRRLHRCRVVRGGWSLDAALERGPVVLRVL